MKEYEISYIVDPSLAEEQRGDVDAAVDTAVTSHGGSVASNTDSIRRRLAYQIRKQHIGFARTLQTSVEAEEINTLRDEIAKVNGILRLSVIQTAARPEVSTAIFEAATKEQQVEPKKVEETPAAEISDAEVDTKIEEALDEEVK
ncbi:30S ribosomal protein S6 [bacterium]|nr:30S ribosomal protein S6 [bacterium]